MRRPGLLLVGGLAAVASIALAGCAGSRPGHRFIAGAGRGPIEVMEQPFAAPRQPSPEALARAVDVAAAARVAAPALPTAESTNPELRGALAALAASDTAEAHQRAAQAYRAAGIADQALDHFDAALVRDDRLASAYDGRARIWRDWGLPGLALGDATRAAYYASGSAAAHNTLGTVLLQLGRCDQAAAAFRRALGADPAAAYAATNLQSVERAAASGHGACRAQAPAGPAPPAKDAHSRSPHARHP